MRSKKILLILFKSTLFDIAKYYNLITKKEGIENEKNKSFND